jgi:excisionase family DNA binding protein
MVKKRDDILAAEAADPLLFPAEVAILFRVDPKTVTRWTHQGKLPFIRTIGGHRRYRTSVVMGMLNGDARSWEK